MSEWWGVIQAVQAGWHGVVFGAGIGALVTYAVMR